MSRTFPPDPEAWARYKAHRKALREAGAVWDSSTAYTPRRMADAGVMLWFPVKRGRGSKRRAVAFIPYMSSWSPGCGLCPIVKGDPHEYLHVETVVQAKAVKSRTIPRDTFNNKVVLGQNNPQGGKTE